MREGIEAVPLLIKELGERGRWERGRWFKVNLLFGNLYGSVLGGEGFVAELGGECGGAL
jgi:hypothetical protein